MKYDGQIVWRAIISLVVFAALGTALITVTKNLTRTRIAMAEAAGISATLQALLPTGLYDNDPATDRVLLLDAALLGSQTPLPAWRATRRTQPVAAVMTVIAPDGFVGPVRLLVGIRFDGSLIAVRVLEHEETPGLGDGIDRNRSNWIDIFVDRSLEKPATEFWTTSQSGSEPDTMSGATAVRGNAVAFDQISGATVTSRAVIHAVRDALIYFRMHRNEIFAAPSVDAEHMAE